MSGLVDLQKSGLFTEKAQPKNKKGRHFTNDKCEICGSSNLAFRRYGMIDNEGYIHSGYPDWYRCLDCHSWVLAYPINESGRL